MSSMSISSKAINSGLPTEFSVVAHADEVADPIENLMGEWAVLPPAEAASLAVMAAFVRSGDISSFEELIQRFLALYKELKIKSSVLVDNAMLTQFETALKAAAEQFKATFTGGVVTLVCSGVGFVFGAGMVGAKGLQMLRDRLSKISNPQAKPPLSDSAQMPSAAKPTDNPTGVKSSPSSRRDARKVGEEDSSPPARSAATDDSVQPPAKGPKHMTQSEISSIVSGLLMFALPNVGQGAGQVASAFPQKVAEEFKAISELVSQWVGEVQKEVGDYQSGMQALVSAYANN